MAASNTDCRLRLHLAESLPNYDVRNMGVSKDRGPCDIDPEKQGSDRKDTHNRDPSRSRKCQASVVILGQQLAEGARQGLLQRSLNLYPIPKSSKKRKRKPM